MPVSPWCNSPWKRLLDVSVAFMLLVLLSPVMLLVAISVRFSSPGPVFFRQRRPGRNGVEFTILKFRTMIQSHQGPALSWAADPRITRFGRFLRKWKLDELPQILNVIRGDMSLVGPRPLPPALWDDDSLQPQAVSVLSVRPGIMGEMALRFHNEEELLIPLSSLSPAEAEAEYRRRIMPAKVRLELGYVSTASFRADCGIIFSTISRVLIPRRSE